MEKVDLDGLLLSIIRVYESIGCPQGKRINIGCYPGRVFAAAIVQEYLTACLIQLA